MSGNDMFVNKEDFIEITLYYRRGEKGNGVKVVKDLETIREDVREEYKEITFKMRPMTWGYYNLLQKEAITNEGLPNERIDWMLYRQKKLVGSLKGWDAKDGDGNEIPVTKENIMKLHPVIAESILNAYDANTFLGDDDVKKF